MSKKAASITVTRRKLGRHQAVGLAHGDGRIEVDERLRGRPHMEVLIHEFFHEWEWMLPEEVVGALGRDLSKFLHKNNARMIEEDCGL
jgi:hypothetical protein